MPDIKCCGNPRAPRVHPDLWTCRSRVGVYFGPQTGAKRLHL